MAPPLDWADPSRFRVVRKDNPAAPLTDEQMTAIGEWIKSQGNIAAINPASQKTLATLRAFTANDPNIAGSAAIADFSLRAVSIHRTWSVFKGMQTAPWADPSQLDRTNIRLDSIVKQRND